MDFSKIPFAKCDRRCKILSLSKNSCLSNYQNFPLERAPPSLSFPDLIWLYFQNRRIVIKPLWAPLPMLLISLQDALESLVQNIHSYTPQDREESTFLNNSIQTSCIARLVH